MELLYNETQYNITKLTHIHIDLYTLDLAHMSNIVVLHVKIEC